MPTAWSYVWPCPSPRSETWLERELTQDELRQIGYKEPPASPADSGRLEMNPTHLPTRGDHGPDRETAISPGRR